MAWVVGGSGHVGRSIVSTLSHAGYAVRFTYFRSTAVAEDLAAAHRHSRALCCDLRIPASVHALVTRLRAEDHAPQVVVYAAAVSHGCTLSELSPEALDDALAVNCRAPLLLLPALSRWMKEAPLSRREIILIGALTHGQSLPLPAHFAATQTFASGLAMALAKELGSDGFRVNQLALGLLAGGLSSQISARARADYQAFSALRRFGTADEVARVVLWLAQHNTFMTGRVFAVNGGL